MPLCTEPQPSEPVHLAVDRKRSPATPSASSKSGKAGPGEKTRVKKTCLCVDTVTTKKERHRKRQIFDGLGSHYCAKKGHPKLGTVYIPKVIPVDFYKTAKFPQEFDFFKKYY